MNERVMVASPYPTMSGPESAAAFELVRRLVGEGHDVTVVSPRPSAAHHHADPGSPRGAAKLVSLAGGRDRLIVRLDASALAAANDGPKLLPARLALAAAFRRVARVEVILDRVPAQVSAQWAKLVLGSASRVSVATEGERGSLVAAGVAQGTVDVDASILPPTPDRVLDAMRGGEPYLAGLEGASVTAAAIEDVIRRRAAEMQTPFETGTGPHGSASTASKPLRSLPRLERPAIRSNNPGYVVVKRAQLKLLAWMFDWVIQHVNRLHAATIEAIDLAEAKSPEAQAGEKTAS